MRNPVSNTKLFGSRRVEHFLTPEERHTRETVLQQGVRMKVTSDVGADREALPSVLGLLYTARGAVCALA